MYFKRVLSLLVELFCFNKYFYLTMSYVYMKQIAYICVVIYK